MTCSRPATLVVTHVKFDFLSLLPVTESLAVRGRRLHDTPQQRQNKVYAPDVLIRLDVEDSGYRLQSSFVDNRPLSLYQGEYKQLDVHIHNAGSRAIGELWVVTEPYSEVWLDGANLDASGEDKRYLSACARLIISQMMPPRTQARFSVQIIPSLRHLLGALIWISYTPLPCSSLVWT